MRVLHVISTLDPRSGGPAAAVNGLVKAQAAAGLNVSLVSTYRADAMPDVQHLNDAGVRIELIGPAAGPLMRHPDLSAALRRRVADCDEVHIHAVWEEIQFQATRLARMRNVPYVITPHGMLTPWSLAQKRWKKRLYLALRLRRMLQGAAALHYTTAMEQEACGGLNLAAKAIVEPIGIALEEFENLPPRDALRRRFPQIAGRPIVLFLGRIHPGKGLEYLLPAMARIGMNVVLVIAGPDSKGFRATIEQMVAQHGLQDRVIFTGMLSGIDRVEALAGADLFALPSDHENFGLSVVESLAAGVPVIVSHEVGVGREIVAAGVGSEVAREPEAVAAEIRRWLNDRQLRETAASRCRPYVWERYDWRKIAGRWAGAYRAMIEIRSTSA